MNIALPKAELANFRVLPKLLAAFLLILSLNGIGQLKAESNSQDQRQLLQLIEYIGVDYSAAVENGEVIDQGEYQEMQDFAAIIAEKSQTLPAEQVSFVRLAKNLKLVVEQKKSINEIQLITSELKQQLLANSPQLSLPNNLLPFAEVEQIFQSNCSSCHGISGKGDGAIAKQLTPEPTDFTDKERAINRSIMGLYDVISGGLDGTAMPAFSQLSARQRWSLAFQVGSMAFVSENKSNAKQSENSRSNLDANVSLSKIVSYSPKEIVNQNKDIQLVQVEQLRAAPRQLFVNKQDPFSIAQNQLTASLIAYQEKNFIEAKRLAVSAYLDGFELVENGLDAHDKLLRKDIEAKMLALRQALNIAGNEPAVKTSVAEISNLLNRAKILVNESSMSDTTLFSASFIILLREGLEALLVVIALFTILVRSKKQAAIKYLHFGWVAALLAGVLTWIIAQYLVDISGASREIMEGVAAMVAAIILFYVGFWMHNKSQADQWQRYIQQNVDRNLSAGTLWGISSLAFIAVYREVFETVLFYQSLLTQTAESQNLVLVSGFILAVVVLILLAWLMVKYSIKLPIGRFFSMTTYLLLVLSFILMGKAVSALQEAAIVGISPFWINFQVDWLGINSTWQGLMAQVSILVLSLGLILWPWIKVKFSAQPKSS